LVALAEIKNIALNNKEHIEGIKRELAIIARQNKPAFTGVVTQSPGLDTSVLDAIREHLTELQSEQEKLALTADRQHSQVIEDLSRKQVNAKRSFFLGHMVMLCRWIQAFVFGEVPKGKKAGWMGCENVPTEKQFLPIQPYFLDSEREGLCRPTQAWLTLYHIQHSGPLTSNI